jgi:DNA-binding GntR family transcriptional regulator
MTPPTTQTSTRENRAEVSYLQICEMIVDARLAPGSRIIETDIVDRLEVSRTTVRSALQRLEQEGLVTRLEGGRARWFVSALTVSDVREIAEIMSALEGIAGRRVADIDDPARRKLVENLRSINYEFREVTKQQSLNSARAAELDAAFHRTFVDAAKRPRLIGFCDNLKSQVQRYQRSYMAYLAPIASTSVEEHEAIIAAIERGDADATEIAIESNWLQAAERYVSVIETVGERGAW